MGWEPCTEETSMPKNQPPVATMSETDGAYQPIKEMACFSEMAVRTSPSISTTSHQQHTLMSRIVCSDLEATFLNRGCPTGNQLKKD